MGRVQTFDTDEAVRAARELFWERGYEAVSVPELEVATGVGRSSLYHAFGSKRGLFDAAVQNYLDEVVRPRLRPLQAHRVEPTALRDYLTGLRDALAAGAASRLKGCLLVNTAGAPVARDEAVAEVIRNYRAELHAAFRRGAAAAEADESLATLCTSSVVAAFVLARIDPAQAAAALDGAIALVQAQSGAR